MPFPHIFISTLWFVSSILCIYPYIIGFKNTSEMKESFAFVWVVSIITAISCSGTVGLVYVIDPTSPENILDWSNLYHLASYVANLAFASMILVKQSQTRIAVIETLKNGYKVPFVLCGLAMDGIKSLTSLTFNQLQGWANIQKEYMSR